MILKILILIIFIGVTVGVGFYARRKNNGVTSFVLGGRTIGPWLTAFAYGTSYFSSVVFVGYAGQFGWKYGIASTWIGIGNAIIGSLLAWAILAKRTMVMTRKLDSATMPDFFGKRFDSKPLQIVASLIVFVFLIPYTASLYNGLSRLFEMAFHIDYAVCVIVMAALTCVYVVVGGYLATALNDFIQGSIMLLGISLVIGAVLKSQGGFINALDSLAKIEDASVSTTPGVFASFFGPDPLNLLGVVILTSLGTWGLPQMVHKFYAIKDEKAIRYGIVISTMFALVVAGGCYFLGGFGRMFSAQIDIAKNGYDSIIPTILSTLPDALIGIVIILVLSASMSTLSSLVLTSSSSLTLDLIKPVFVKDMDEKKQLLVMRIFIVFFVVISAVLAIIQYRSNVMFIAQLMGVSWGALAGAFLAPFMYGLYMKRTTRAACWFSFCFGSLFMIANMLFRSSFPVLLQSPINAGACAMLVGIIAVPIISLITPKMKKEKVEEIFSCFKD